MEEYSLVMEYLDVDVKHIFFLKKNHKGRQECVFFEGFSVSERGAHPVASKSRWDDRQRRRKPQEEKAWKEREGLEQEEKRMWFAAHEVGKNAEISEGQ